MYQYKQQPVSAEQNAHDADKMFLYNLANFPGKIQSCVPLPMCS